MQTRINTAIGEAMNVLYAENNGIPVTQEQRNTVQSLLEEAIILLPMLINKCSAESIHAN